ncbi:MAG TPA: DnaJ domain-containing protein, partial [Roseiflexaceae bacterium]|nr:DnaJ domain-containing protein [Roseiflexaceae bacterium]
MADFENLDYYELLGVPRSASIDEIKRAYRREISKYHPDRFVNGTAEEHAYARQRSQRLTEAYRVLSDFSERSAYNRGQASAGSGNRPPRPTAPPTQPRDHQAELYDQAQRYMAENRPLQAIGVLRQLQQINPFYRDSAELLATAEAQLNRRQKKDQRSIGRPLLVAGGMLGGIALAVLAAWAIGMRGATANRGAQPTSALAAVVATDLPTRPPEPTLSPLTPITQPTAAPTDVPATAGPTDAPTSAALEPPTAVPSPTPFDFPTITPVPAAASEEGALLGSDAFAQSGWANMRGPGWQVGYQNQRYRISANRGIGTIWSYRTGLAKDAGIGVDMQVARGEGGLLLRFQDANNYISVSL